MFGLIFLGAATYLIYGTLDPHWSNAVGQLAGFLAYDAVLLAPFFGRFSTARGGSLVSLIIYVAFLVYSGTLASYYLFASNATRIRLAFIGSEPQPALDAGDADPRRTPRGSQHHLPIRPIRLSHSTARATAPT
jgi:thiol:disulfide interchange protein